MLVDLIGTGSVGTALATGLSAAGHDVVLGSREPGDGQFETVDQRAAAERGEVVVLAVPGGAVESVAADLAEQLAGKPVVDPTNEYPRARSEQSLAERVAAAEPGARVVKAFNTVGAERMTDPVVGGSPATMFLAGDDTDAVAAVSGLAADLGFEPLIVGGLADAVHLEHLARLWIHLSGAYGREIAFRLLR